MNRLFASSLAIVCLLVVTTYPCQSQTTCEYQIVACVNPRGGTTRILCGTGETTCKKNEQMLTWSIVGPQGPAGPQGPPGPTATGGCWDYENQFVDCGDGTVTDTESGLIWLKDPGCFSTPMDYVEPNNAASHSKDGDCGLTDGSAEGSWRIPSEEEWRTLLDNLCGAGEWDGYPALKGKSGLFVCFAEEPWATGVTTDYLYWSAGIYFGEQGFAVSLVPEEYWPVPHFRAWHKTNTAMVWPVREYKIRLGM